MAYTPVRISTYQKPLRSGLSGDLTGKNFTQPVAIGGAIYLLLTAYRGASVFKSINSGATWSRQDAAGEYMETTSNGCHGSVCYGGGKFHWVFHEEFTDTIWYQAFDTSTDTWSTAVDLELASQYADAMDVTIRSAYRSDGSVVFSYHTDDSSYTSLLGVIEDGALTDSAIEIDSSIIALDQFLIDSNDRLHILYSPYPMLMDMSTRYLYHKSWDGSSFSAQTTVIDNTMPSPYNVLHNRVGRATINGNRIVVPFAKDTDYWENTWGAYDVYTQNFPTNCIMAVAYSDALTSPTWSSVEVSTEAAYRPDVLPAAWHHNTSAITYFNSAYHLIWGSEWVSNGFYGSGYARHKNKMYRSTSADLATWTTPEEMLDSTFFEDIAITPEFEAFYASVFNYPVTSFNIAASPTDLMVLFNTLVGGDSTSDPPVAPLTYGHFLRAPGGGGNFAYCGVGGAIRKGTANYGFFV